jgi:hypothetical protein
LLQLAELQLGRELLCEHAPPALLLHQWYALHQLHEAVANPSHTAICFFRLHVALCRAACIQHSLTAACLCLQQALSAARLAVARSHSSLRMGLFPEKRNSNSSSSSSKLMKQLQRLTANAATQLHAVRAAILAWLTRAQRAATLAAVGMAAAVMLLNPGGAVAYPKEYTLSTPIPDVLDTPRHMPRDQWVSQRTRH